jgi:4-hydroxy-2-oxoheptanedioate aldolase
LARPVVGLIRQRLQERGFALNTFFQTRDPVIVEIVGLAGFDAVSIDLEHVSYGEETVEELIAAAELAGVGAIVRIPERGWATATRVLDLGAGGIQVPHIETVVEAREAIDAVRFAPLGKRGAMPVSRATRYGSVPWEEFRARSNSEIVLNLMIESRVGLDNAAEIAALDGVDFLVVGQHDLATDLGVSEVDDPRLWSAVMELADTVRRAGRAGLGLALGDGMLRMTFERARDLGAGYLTVVPSPERIMLDALRSRLAPVLKRSEPAT